MPKDSAAVPIGGLTLDRDTSIPLYQQLYEWLRLNIEAGQLPPGSRMPATRTLAKELNISRNTVLLAYERLLLEGYVKGQVGSGTRVADLADRRSSSNIDSVLPLPVPVPEGSGALNLSRIGNEILRASRWLDLLPEVLRDPERPFTVGVPALDLFPIKTWARMLAHRANRMKPLLSDQDPAGFWPLRNEISAYLSLLRGVRCTPDQIIIVCSSHVAVNLLARVLLDPSSQVLVENPGFPGTRAALIAAGLRLCPTPVDSEGLCISLGESRYPTARMAIVTPTNQFPLCVRMSDWRRSQLLDWAGRVDGWVIEDDYDGEYWVGESAVPLQRMDSSDRVIYVGTFSKVLFPALRLAYLVVPPNLIDVVTAAQRASISSLPVLEQATLTDFIASNHFARHLRVMREACIVRRNSCVDALRSVLGHMVQVNSPAVGMHLTMGFPADVSERELTNQSRQARLRVYPFSRYYLGETTTNPKLVLGYGATPPDQIRAGVQRLATALDRSTRAAMG